MFYMYFVLVIIAVFFYILYKGVISFLILVFVLSLPMVTISLLLIARRKISAELKMNVTRSSAGQNIPIDIIINNRSIFPITICEIRLRTEVSSSHKPDIIRINTPIFPRNSQKLSTAFCSEHYGAVNCSIAKIYCFDLLRIFRVKIPAKRIKNKEASVLLIPEPLELVNAVSDYSELALESEMYSPSKPGDDPSEIFSIHEYTDGDKLSKVHWKLTAKEDKLMVKDYSLPLADSLLLITDTYIPDSHTLSREDIYDTLTQLTVSISRRLLESDRRHRLCVYEEKSGSAQKISVHDDTSCAEACVLLLNSGICTKPSLAAAEIISEASAQRRFGHMILITAQLDPQIAALLSESPLAYRFSVLLCSEDKQQALAEDINAQLINVQPHNIEGSLAELVF